MDLSRYPYVDLELFSKLVGDVPGKSGLNWGQRSGREPNQAYIHIPRSAHKQNPGFFPGPQTLITINTDDGHSLECVIAQQDDKAIETHYDNSELGRYFRHRLGVRQGDPVSINDLHRYGRTSVRIYKISDYEYYMDFNSN